MAIANTMHQIAPHTWTFKEPPVPVAPMKARCRICKAQVALLYPVVLAIQTGNFIVRGECERCSGEVLLIVS